MIYFVKITNKGQITIPVEIRRIIKERNLIIDFDIDKREFITKLAPNILNYAGKFKDKAFKGKTIDKIIELENKIISNAFKEIY